MSESLPADQASVQELRDRLAARAAGSDDFLLLDVREDFELQISYLAGVEHVPVGEILADNGRRVARLARDRDVLVLCRSGSRSNEVAAFLRERGVAARNIAGGILAWSSQIDNSVPIY